MYSSMVIYPHVSYWCFPDHIAAMYREIEVLTVASVIKGSICLNVDAHSSLLFFGMSCDGGSMMCSQLGALGAREASRDHLGPWKDNTRASVVFLMFDSRFEDMIALS